MEIKWARATQLYFCLPVQTGFCPPLAQPRAPGAAPVKAAKGVDGGNENEAGWSVDRAFRGVQVTSSLIPVSQHKEEENHSE